MRRDTNLFTLAIQVNEGVTGAGDVLCCHALVHPVDIEVQAAVTIDKQAQDCALGTCVQVGPVVLADLSSRTGVCVRVGLRDGALRGAQRGRRVGGHLEGIVENGVSLQQPGGALQAAGRGGEVEPIGGVADHTQRKRGCPGRVKTVDLKLQPQCSGQNSLKTATQTIHPHARKQTHTTTLYTHTHTHSSGSTWNSCCRERGCAVTSRPWL